jgi:Domain of unknown function (DUF4388)
LSSFLQMLEQERKSCTLIVNSEGRAGRFYFDQGELMDAQFADEVGEKAVYTILAWNHPTFNVIGPEDRMHRIRLPLAHILLTFATKRDEDGISPESDDVSAMTLPREDAAVLANPAVKRVVQAIVRISGIKHYYLLNRQGQVILQSSRTLNLGDFITFSIVSGIQMRKALDAKGPNRIQLVMESGECLLIVPGAGMIIGLLLDELASVNEVADLLMPVLTSP